MALRINPHTGEEIWVEPGCFTPWHTFAPLDELGPAKEGATRVTPKELWKVVDNYGVDICTGFVNSTQASSWVRYNIEEPHSGAHSWRLDTYYEEEPKALEEAPVYAKGVYCDGSKEGVNAVFPSAFDHQEAGGHYKDLAIQPHTYIVKNKLGWNAGNIVKYVSRAERKGGQIDYRKVIHYATMELEEIYGIRTIVKYSE